MSKIQLKNAAGTVVEYDLFRCAGAKATYIGAEHDDLKKDQLVITTVDPKTTATSRGNRRGSMNLVRTVQTPGISGDVVEVLKDAKIEVVTSFPAGMSEQARDELAARVASALSDKDLVKQLFVIGKIS